VNTGVNMSLSRMKMIQPMERKRDERNGGGGGCVGVGEGGG
jgi:hypothetical protein